MDSIDLHNTHKEGFDRDTVIKWLGINSHYLQVIPNPDEELQQIAVCGNGLSIRLIDNPSEYIQNLAIEQNVASIGHIKNPSYELKLKAVRLSGLAIQYIDEPTDELQLEAVTRDPIVIQYLDLPSDEVQLEALKFYYTTFAYWYIMNAHVRKDEEWFNKEVNKLKLKYGPLKNDDR